MEKYRNTTLLILAIIALNSCGTKVAFPVSRVQPAANVVSTVKKESNGNYLIKIDAEHLAAPDRLSPPQKYYYTWVEKDEGLPVNIGRLVSKKNNKAALQTLTPFKPEQIFITAEGEGEVTVPGNFEVFRSKRIKVK
ncbi:hypothetical protein OOZ15_07805 [Galbibacter sp. EGI 63066]|uniref:hypothetical protein n=1 Tax=Galbibacter sp. EGI 63066 TaxID=2993559 RepID=UPI00224907B1|nr:hypothetical protein [Galbibacter sp. EGI 63066]MCX2679836.1 hypothetical protein [Galbibacter sp. EGI 63066]